VNVARAQGAAFQIAKLVEHEQRMIAGAVIVAVPDAVFLFAMRRADARIHVKQDTSRWTATMNAVDPFAGEISERRKVLFRREPQQDSNGNLAVKLLRTFAAQTEALQRYRGKGHQKVTVEHVHVNTGGQAIVESILPREIPVKADSGKLSKPTFLSSRLNPMRPAASPKRLPRRA
jgi:hypothetical protein